MPETITWTVNLNATGGPRIAQTGVLVVEAYDKINVRLEAGASDVDVDVQPAATPGIVSLLSLAASDYDPALTYSADGGTTVVALTAPVVLLGPGAVGLLDATPQQLRLANGTPEAVTVEILVGRDVT